MVDRLKDLVKLPTSFDMEAWLSDIEAKVMKPSGGKYSQTKQVTILKDIGIYRQKD
jgi:hypothetical protein